MKSMMCTMGREMITNDVITKVAIIEIVSGRSRGAVSCASKTVASKTVAIRTVARLNSVNSGSMTKGGTISSANSIKSEDYKRSVLKNNSMQMPPAVAQMVDRH